MISKKNPKFFLAENVPGILGKKHESALKSIIEKLENAGEFGYNVKYRLINAQDVGVPQDRKRVIFIGYRKDLGIEFNFDEFLEKEKEPKFCLEAAIKDLEHSAVPTIGLKTNAACLYHNHEYINMGYSSIYMSRNRVRTWEETSFTIQAGGRHAPMHPMAPKMEFVEKDKYIFKPGHEHDYRRLTVRECARIQTFPDDYKFYYKSAMNGYKMVGNAVPVKLANALANQIRRDLIKLIIK